MTDLTIVPAPCGIGAACETAAPKTAATFAAATPRVGRIARVRRGGEAVPAPLRDHDVGGGCEIPHPPREMAPWNGALPFRFEAA
jgi:hypothetical protein